MGATVSHIVYRDADQTELIMSAAIRSVVLTMTQASPNWPKVPRSSRAEANFHSYSCHFVHRVATISSSENEANLRSYPVSYLTYVAVSSTLIPCGSKRRPSVRLGKSQFSFILKRTKWQRTTDERDNSSSLFVRASI